ncbi:hypothetical protein TKK_0001299 [Trichogramma kaykai]
MAPANKSNNNKCNVINVTQEEKRAPGFKMMKDRYTLLFCSNASGTYRCKPLLVYRSENPRALKGKRKEHLPVIWRSNKTAWVTGTLMMDWFTNSFVPEVKQFLIAENLSFKVLLLMDNAKCHPDLLVNADPNVEVMFLPPNTTSLIQPLDQTVIATFKSYYLRRVVKEMLNHVNQNFNENSDEIVRNFWKKFNILHSITIVDESWREIKMTTLNCCWSKLLPELVDTGRMNGTETITSVLEDVAIIARDIGGEGFIDMTETDLVEVISPSEKEITAEEIEEILAPSEDADEPENNIEAQPIQTLSKISINKILNAVQNAIDEAMSEDPILTRSMLFKHQCEVAMSTYRELQKDYMRRAKQSRLSDFFVKK